MDKGWCGSCYLPDYAMTFQKSIVDGTKEESDFDKSCHSEIDLVIPNAARNLAEHMSRQPSVKRGIPAQSRFLACARNDNSLCFYKLTDHIDNTAQAEQNLSKGE
jgi:hypothetical protein